MEKDIGVEITAQGHIAVVAFKTASINYSEQITAAAEQVKGFIEENHPNGIIFDFERVKFFSSQVLGMLLDIRAKLKTCSGELVISAINPQLYRVFKITHLDKIFRFFPDKESALGAVSIN